MTTPSSLSSVTRHIPWSGIITSDLATSISEGTEFVVGGPELVASLDAAAAAAVAGTWCKLHKNPKTRPLQIQEVPKPKVQVHLCFSFHFL